MIAKIENPFLKGGWGNMKCLLKLLGVGCWVRGVLRGGVTWREGE